MTAGIRVYLVTYRRPVLLRRALASLLAQTFTDWVCELHNDAPGDDTPRAVLEEMAPGDTRFLYRPHDRNWGPVATFNQAHAGSAEPFFSLLEDDNWWEPSFLARMQAVLAERPEADIAWANMRIWQETPAGWSDTGRTIWPARPRPHRSIAWPQLIQFDAPLQSHGALLGRNTAAGARLQTAATIPVDVVENVRERAFRYPVVLVTEPLANFALTLQSARSHDTRIWIQLQSLLGAAFLKHVPLAPAAQAALWSARRHATPPATAALFFAGWLQPTRGWLRHATVGDWLQFARGCVGHPRAALAALRARRRRPDLWAEFDRATAAACARPQSAADIAPLQLARRDDLVR
jgi:hypothetical protein